ncbi:hypothetical protein [Polaribacter cellanae]|uniref:Uncharacterized protein n=1 Tax=Polaribacter cellanae TaxID=2818493 RepID=A0A975H5H8_9FLAO|nr:hypothetical protein [Polaribacter cellanae]QTE21407.1 hypothetical protein J3359_11280 [Polaribacter cellanae]
MNFEQLKIILKDKNVADLKTIIYNVYNKVPDAKDFIDVFVPLEKEVIKQNTEQLFKRYKKQFNEYLLPDILENNTKEEDAFKLLERIRKKNISVQFTIDCELLFVENCNEFIETYGYFDEDYYIKMDEVFESACIKIKTNNLTEEYYNNTVEKLISFGNDYGFEFNSP